MPENPTRPQIDEAVRAIQSRIEISPQVGMILGSGLGPLAEAVRDAVVIPYDEIPHWPVSTVEGHSGQLVIGELEGYRVLVMQGRVHFYEGYPITRLGFSIRVMKSIGVETLIVTNAAGGVNQDYQPGDIMLITDHLNLLGMAGFSPLRGPNLNDFGPRFPDMSQAYDRQLLDLAREVAKEHGIAHQEGVYICLAGPMFETPADLRFLEAVGVDAVGMSTVPEVAVARHSGMRVMAFSGITNKASLDGNKKTTHKEVIEAGRTIGPKMMSLIRGVLRRL